MAEQGLLERLAALSRARAEELRGRSSALHQAALHAAMPLPAPRAGVIAELKRRSPSAGLLTTAGPGEEGDVLGTQLEAYLAGGAAALSVLTEPEAFGGALEDLARAAVLARPAGVPVMRKDVLVDPLQVVESRAQGASGVLLIARILDVETLGRMLDAAEGLGLFALIEAFDHTDLDRVHAALAGRSRAGLLVGVNSRDLHSLAIDPNRLADLAPRLPTGIPHVAESGMHGPEDVQRAAACGYRLALVGTALMQAEHPARLVCDMSAALLGRRSA